MKLTLSILDGRSDRQYFLIHEINEIRARANNLGFSFTGFTEVQQSPHFQNYLEWLERNQLQVLYKFRALQKKDFPYAAETG